MPNIGRSPSSVSETPITLASGITIDGKTHTECTLRMLTRGDRQRAKKAFPDNETAQEDFLLAASIVKLGDVTNAGIITGAIEWLTAPDEVLIHGAIAKIEADALQAVSVPEPSTAIVPVSDIRSAAFSLNPGIVINEKRETTCVVRLLTKGQWKQVEKESDPQRQNDLVLLSAIAQIGNYTDIKEEWLDGLVETDADRIDQEIRRLREQYAPTPKSCPECGAVIAA